MNDLRVVDATGPRCLTLHDIERDYVIMARRPKVFMRGFRDVYIGPEGIADENVEWLSHDFTRRTEPKAASRQPGPIVLLGGNKNFGHWMFEYMTRVAVIDRTMGDRMFIGVWDDVPQTFVDFLKFAGHEVVRFEAGWFKHVWVPSCPFGRTPDKHLFAWPEASHHLRAKLSKYRLSQKSGRKIYAQRNAKTRKILNDDDVVTCVKAHGFDIVDFGQLTAKEQIKAASEASVIVMPNGAAAPITMLSDATIIELNNPQMDGTFGCRMWAVCNGNPYHRIIGTPESNEPSIDVNYTIDVERLDRCLTNLP